MRKFGHFLMLAQELAVRRYKVGFVFIIKCRCLIWFEFIGSGTALPTAWWQCPWLVLAIGHLFIALVLSNMESSVFNLINSHIIWLVRISYLILCVHGPTRPSALRQFNNDSRVLQRSRRRGHLTFRCAKLNSPLLDLIYFSIFLKFFLVDIDSFIIQTIFLMSLLIHGNLLRIQTEVKTYMRLFIFVNLTVDLVDIVSSILAKLLPISLVHRD